MSIEYHNGELRVEVKDDDDNVLDTYTQSVIVAMAAHKEDFCQEVFAQDIQKHPEFYGKEITTMDRDSLRSTIYKGISAMEPIVEYVHGDVFDYDKDDKTEYMLAHCIASDFGLVGGIAKQFNDKKNMRKLLWDWAESTNQKIGANPYGYGGKAVAGIVGTSVLIGNTYNLVTKTWTYEKPTYVDMLHSLESLRDQMLDNEHTQLVIPKIGCGIDNMDWEVVECLIYKVFKGTNTHIYVVER